MGRLQTSLHQQVRLRKGFCADLRGEGSTFISGLAFGTPWFSGEHLGDCLGGLASLNGVWFFGIFWVDPLSRPNGLNHTANLQRLETVGPAAQVQICGEQVCAGPPLQSPLWRVSQQLLSKISELSKARFRSFPGFMYQSFVAEKEYLEARAFARNVPFVQIHSGNNSIMIFLYISETSRIRFRRARFQTPNSMSFLALTEFQGESPVSSSQPFLCVPKRTHRVFLQNSPSLPQNSVRLREFSSPKQYSRNSIPPVS